MKNLYLLPTKKPSKLVKIYNDVNRETFTLKLDVEVNDSFKEHVNIYITSDEEIKEGDIVKIPCGVGKVKELNWKFGNDNPSYIVEDIFIYKLRYGQKERELQINSFRYEDVKKIILTTNQDLINDGVQAIDDEFLEWFVKNPNCNRVEISLEETQYGSGIYEYIIYKKEITKKEPKKDLEKEMFELEQELDIPSHLRWYNSKTKQESIEEAAEKYSENWEEITGLDYENTVPSEVNKLDFINGAKWKQEQNKNLYSEEDLLKFGAFVRIEDKKEKRLFLIQDYFKKWKQI